MDALSSGLLSKGAMILSVLSFFRVWDQNNLGLIIDFVTILISNILFDSRRIALVLLRDLAYCTLAISAFLPFFADFH